MADETGPYQDRSTGLIIFGVLEIGGGALCALAIPIMLVGVLMTRRIGGAKVPLTSFPVNVLSYALLAGALITLGIGAIQAKRWARALNLILSWFWLCTGLLTTGIVMVVLPVAMRSGMHAAAQNQNSGAAPAAMMAVIATMMIVFLALFFIVAPLAFLLFYRSKNVEETCRRRDPVERWTDRLPLPILGMVLLAGFGAVYSSLLAISTPMFPLFGKYLTGIRGAAFLLLFAAVDVYVAVSFFRMKVAGWWVATVAVVFRMVSAILTYARGNVNDLYNHMGWSAEQTQAMQMNPVLRSGAFLWVGPLIMVVYVGYVIWLKRYFRAAAPAGYTGMPQVPDQMQPGS